MVQGQGGKVSFVCNARAISVSLLVLVFRLDPQFSPRRRYDKNWMIQHINKTRLIRGQIPSLAMPPVTSVAQMAPPIAAKVVGLGGGVSLILRSPPDVARPQDLKHLTPKPVRSRSAARRISQAVAEERIQGGKWCSSNLFHSDSELHILCR